MMYVRIVVHDQYTFEIAHARSTISDRRPLSKPMLIEVRHKDEICLVRCEGHFITADQEYLRAKKDEIKGANCKKVLADFSDVSDIGSAGIGFYRRRLHVRQELRWAFRTRGDTTPCARSA